MNNTEKNTRPGPQSCIVFLMLPPQTTWRPPDPTWIPAAPRPCIQQKLGQLMRRGPSHTCPVTSAPIISLPALG